VDLSPHRDRAALDGNPSRTECAVISLEELNFASPAVFTQDLEGVFEHSTWVAERTASRRPFDSRLALLDALRATVDGAGATEQMALIRAHPQLGVRGRQRAALTSASAGEQRRAGLDACTVAELERLEELNAAYVAKFEMPYILAVRGHDPKSIIAHAERRLRQSMALERRQALDEIGLIAGYRLADRVMSPPGAETLAMLRRLKSRANAGGLIREWLLAADLDVSEEPGRLTGRRRCGTERSQTLVIGAAPELSRENSLVALAVAQQLRQRGVRLPFDLLVVIREEATRVPGEPEAAALEGLAHDLEEVILNNARSFEQHGALTYG
jgi:2-oxo-4-hydroxy-4-carboxy-5-ureidoimidazoline decarboxylase